jgi:hypothetical protein
MTLTFATGVLLVTNLFTDAILFLVNGETYGCRCVAETLRAGVICTWIYTKHDATSARKIYSREAAFRQYNGEVSGNDSLWQRIDQINLCR